MLLLIVSLLEISVMALTLLKNKYNHWDTIMMSLSGNTI